MAKRDIPRELTGPASASDSIASLSPVIVPLALMLGELLAHHEALVAKLIEQGILDGEELDRFCSRYMEKHLPAARQRVVAALKSSLEDDGAPPPRPAKLFSIRRPRPVAGRSAAGGAMLTRSAGKPRGVSRIS